MGSTPITTPKSKTRTAARVVSFSDAKRKRAQNAEPAVKTRPLSSSSKPIAKASGAKASTSQKLGAKPAGTKTVQLSSASTALTAPVEKKPQARKAKPAARKAAQSAKAASKAQAKPASKRKQSRKEIKIARGAEREGALAMRTEEEIEAEAREQEESRKQEARKNSKVRAFAEGAKKKSEAKKRARTKAKAEKKFNAAYGGDSKGASAAAASEGAPRAAIYEGKMGAKHKKSAKMQAKAAGTAIASAASSFDISKVNLPNLPKLPKGLERALMSVAIVALFTMALYGPAQQYYTQMRETDRLQAEYAAVAARSNSLQSTIDSLSSEEGIEDKAHTDLGYVKKGEQTATVKGANIIDNTEFSSNVAPGSIDAPDTWYSPFFDIFFGYSN